MEMGSFFGHVLFLVVVLYGVCLLKVWMEVRMIRRQWGMVLSEAKVALKELNQIYTSLRGKCQDSNEYVCPIARLWAAYTEVDRYVSKVNGIRLRSPLSVIWACLWLREEQNRVITIPYFSPYTDREEDVWLYVTTTVSDDDRVATATVYGLFCELQDTKSFSGLKEAMMVQVASEIRTHVGS